MQFQLDPDLKSSLDLMTIITRDNLQVTLLLVCTQENQGTEGGIHLFHPHIFRGTHLASLRGEKQALLQSLNGSLLGGVYIIRKLITLEKCLYSRYGNLDK